MEARIRTSLIALSFSLSVNLDNLTFSAIKTTSKLQSHVDNSTLSQSTYLLESVLFLVTLAKDLVYFRKGTSSYSKTFSTAEIISHSCDITTELNWFLPILFRMVKSCMVVDVFDIASVQSLSKQVIDESRLASILDSGVSYSSANFS